jgi:predicted acyl esterase
MGVAAEAPGPSGPDGAGRDDARTAESRNLERRAGRGIDKAEDVRIPLRDGSYLLADVYRPVADGRYPVIVRLGVYGRAFAMGSVCDEESRRASEAREDAWFEHGPPENATPAVRFSENIVSANAFDWVPRGYVCVRVDARGVGRVPGVIDPFSRTEARDYYDVIEWAAGQPWSTGAVGLYGGSYQATVQWAVAALGPPSLRAMIAWSGDGDPYRELSHPGGIFIRGYREAWLRDLVTPNQCGPEPAVVDVVEAMASHPFDEPEVYGPQGAVVCGGDYSTVATPFLTAVNIAAIVHGRAGAEAICSAPAAHAELVVVDANYWEFMYRDCLAQQFAFFDRHLKGQESPTFAKVRMIMRTGHGSFEWWEGPQWPPAGTEYRPLYLEATTPGGGAMSPSVPVAGAVAEYPAEVPADPLAPQPGLVFDSSPLPDDLALAGHLNATLWVSSTSADMDVYATVRVLDPSGVEVPYAVRPREPGFPLAHGCLKVSHRALDPVRTSERRPWHTHRQADHAPLSSPDEIVPIEIELSITTAWIPRDHRVRLILEPFEGFKGPGGRTDDRPGMVAGRTYDPSYHAGATNRLHTGPDHPSHIRLPVVPWTPGPPA